MFALHGVPACGAGFDWADEPARERDVRVIAPDRPGVGFSTTRDGWSVADYARDLAAFADTLQIDSLAVWGYSGGGPYTLACASLLGSRVRATAVAAGMGRIGDWATIEDFAKTDRQMLTLAAHRPAPRPAGDERGVPCHAAVAEASARVVQQGARPARS